MARIQEHELSREMRDYMREMNRLGAMAEADGYHVHLLGVWTSPAPESGEVARKVCDLIDYEGWREANVPGEDRGRDSVRRLLEALRDSEWCGNCEECTDASCAVPDLMKDVEEALGLR